MDDSLSRRDWLQVMSAAGAGALLPTHGAGPVPIQHQAPPILPLSSTSEVFTPPRGRALMKFSFDFPEPSIEFAGLRFSFIIFSRENAYSLDPKLMTVTRSGDGARLSVTGLRWAGGQEAAPGQLTAEFRQTRDGIEWQASVTLDQPVKAVTAIIRGLPRGRLSAGGNSLFDPHDDEVLLGYPFGAGDLFGGNTAEGLSTPLAIIEGRDGGFHCIASLDDQVRAKRLYFQPGPAGYRIEAVFEAEGWTDSRQLAVPAWRIGRTATLADAVQRHYGHLERAYRIPHWQDRSDVPPWIRDTALVLALHGMHYTGYIFNDYARMLEILTWVAEEIPARHVLVFLPAWDGRYYWDYPLYEPAPRLGGAQGFARLIAEGKRLGFRFMPMFGANCANRRQPGFERFADAATSRIDGDRFDLTWVDWDSDRHQEGWLAYMNLGVDSWREWLTARIAGTIDRFAVDAYFLDIIGGWVDNPRADMHAGARRMVGELRARYPNVLACGEFHYDALLEFIPLYQVRSPQATPYARFFQHLSHPAPGRGSSGVHESGFNPVDPRVPIARTDGLIPTLTVVDDTFGRQRDAMKAVIRQAREWAGLSGEHR
jgi:hypothetical protein